MRVPSYRTLRLQFSTRITTKKAHLSVSYFRGDPGGSRTRDLQDENLTSWTTRRRGHEAKYRLAHLLVSVQPAAIAFAAQNTDNSIRVMQQIESPVFRVVGRISEGRC